MSIQEVRGHELIQAKPDSISLRDWFSGIPLNELEVDLLRQQYEAATDSNRYSFQELRYFNADRMLEARASHAGRPVAASEPTDQPKLPATAPGSPQEGL